MEQSENRRVMWVGIIAILCFGLAVGMGFKMISAQRTLNEETGRFKKTEVKLEQQRGFLIFEDRLLGTIKSGDDQQKDLQTAEPSSAEDLISALEKVKQKYDTGANNANALDIPAIMPAGVTDLLRQAKENMADANSLKAEAMDAFITFWRSQPGSPEEATAMSDYKGKLEEANNAVTETESNLKEARIELNLPTLQTGNLGKQDMSGSFKGNEAMPKSKLDLLPK